MLSASFENYKRLSDGKDDNKWAQPPEPLTQAVGDQFLVVLTHFVSPSDLVVQKVENAGELHFICVMKAEPLQPVSLNPTKILVCRTYPGFAAEAERSLRSDFYPAELQTCSWNGLLCPVLR